ncbi:hypothetical protein WKH56_19935 [Priestia sp. SB1]|uniref:hypothetical protein n=1 Tax=Priestia sp. SB1 TaxID=3132359 RepID=UPI0031711754
MMYIENVVFYEMSENKYLPNLPKKVSVVEYAYAKEDGDILELEKAEFEENHVEFYDARDEKKKFFINIDNNKKVLKVEVIDAESKQFDGYRIVLKVLDCFEKEIKEGVAFE